MGIIGSKSKKNKNSQGVVTCSGGYRKLTESPNNSINDEDNATTAKTEAIDMCKKTGEDTAPNQTMSLSLTTQVSPKSQPLSNSSVHGTRSDCPLPPKTKGKKSKRLELAPLSLGKLGDKESVRKQLEEQGLLSDVNRVAKGEGILGELREVGIVQQNKLPLSSDPDVVFMMSVGEPRRRLPARLAHLPVADASLSEKIRGITLGTNAPTENAQEVDSKLRAIETINDSTTGKVDTSEKPADDKKNAGDTENAAAPGHTIHDIMSRKIKLVDLETL